MAEATTNDDGEPICGADTDHTDDRCQMRVSDPTDRCHMHPPDGSGPADGHGSGSPDRNELAAKAGYEGDNGPPEGNKNALSHGVYAAERDPTGLFGYFREENPAVASMIRRWFWSYMNDAPFDPYAADGYDRHNPPVIDVVDTEAAERQQAAADDAADLDTVTVSQGPPRQRTADDAPVIDVVDTEAAERQQAAADDAADLDTVTVSQGPPRQRTADDAPPIDVQALTGKAHRLFVICVHQAVLSNVALEQAKQVLTALEPLTDEHGAPIPDGKGGIVEVEDELPVNLPKARMRARDLRWLKDLGIMDDPESQKAEQMGDWVDVAERVAEQEDHGGEAAN